MANIKFTDFLGDFDTLKDDYTPNQMHTVMEDSSNKLAVYYDEDGGQTITLKGSGFTFLDGDLLKGNVEKIVFRDNDGNTTTTISGADFKAKQLDDLLTDGFDLTNFLAKAYGGKDRVTGTDHRDLAWGGNGDDRIFALDGNDTVNGEGGDDKMTGGGGSDVFFFMYDGKGGKDVVTDFDATGGDENQDYIEGDFEAVLSIKQVGDDLVLDYGDGNTLTLLDVDKSDFGKADFTSVI